MASPNPSPSIPVCSVFAGLAIDQQEQKENQGQDQQGPSLEDIAACLATLYSTPDVSAKEEKKIAKVRSSTFTSPFVYNFALLKNWSPPSFSVMHHLPVFTHTCKAHHITPNTTRHGLSCILSFTSPVFWPRLEKEHRLKPLPSFLADPQIPRKGKEEKYIVRRRGH